MDMPAMFALEIIAVLVVGTHNSVLVATVGAFVSLLGALMAACEGVMGVEF